MKSLGALIVIVLALLVPGCATSEPTGPKFVAPTPSEIQASDPGPVPTDYEAAIREFWASRLKDPTSPLYAFRSPVKGYSSRLPDGQPYCFGWRIPYALNAKNSYGGYSGNEAYSGFFKDGKLRAMYREIGDSPVLIETLPQ